MNVPDKRLLLALLAGILVSGCSKSTPPATDDNTASTTTPADNATALTSSASPTEAAAVPPPKEISHPAAGKGNVQGKVDFNDKPAVNIEVTLSEKFSSFFGASGKSYTARTDKNGDYVIKNVPPKEYEGLTARVFDTNSVIFIKSGIIDAKKYTVEADKTLFVDTTNLFKSDLKVLAPKASGTMPGKSAVFKWQAYPSAAYYKISVYPDNFKVSTDIYDVRVDGTSYTPDKPITAGGYRLELEAYNSNDHKLAEGPDQYKFHVS